MKFWVVLFVILLLILDVIWMLDGVLNVQYGELLQKESYLNSTTTLALRLFGDKPLVSLYYRIIISLLIAVLGIVAGMLFRRISKYKHQLTDSNLKYRTLFMEMKSGFALRRIIRDEEGKIKDIIFIDENPAFRFIIGKADDELKGKTVTEIFGDYNDELIREYDRIARYGGSFTTIHYGKKINKILRITAYQHENDVFATIVDDITKEKRTEDELIESAQLKDILLDTISESVCYLNTELRVIWTNSKAQKMVLNKEKEIIGNQCYKLWCGIEKNCDKCPALRTLSSYQAETEEFTNPNGRFLRVYSSPVFSSDRKIKGIVMTMIDLTEWMNSIRTLERKQAHLNIALESGRMTAWEWESETGNIKMEPAVIIDGKRHNNWSLNELDQYIYPSDRTEFHKQIDELLKGNRKELKIELRILTRKKFWTWFNVLGRIQQSSGNDAPSQMIGISYNIDRLKRTALKLTDLKDKLEKEVEVRLTELREKDILMIRQSRQAAMGEMIGNIAHQWRQPLNSVGVIIQDMIDAWDFGEINREYIIEKVNLGMSIINHMSNTIDDFRDFFSPDNMPSDFNLDEQIRKTVNILKDMYSNQGIEITTSLKSIPIHSYARELSQVIINILNNAKDALLHNKIAEPKIDVKLTESKGEIVLSISDNAGGIPEDIIDKIFDPYFTTKQDKNGTGVGLYMSKNIIEKHIKGFLNVSNTQDGARFEIILGSSSER